MQEILEGLAEKIIKDALENIRRLGFVVMVEDSGDPTPVGKVYVISQEQLGDY